MLALLFAFMDRLGRFQIWFDRRFGWFFTNGMKARDLDRQRPLRA